MEQTDSPLGPTPKPARARKPQSGARVSDRAKAALLAATRKGASRSHAARSGGFTLQTFYAAARHDPLFKQAWEEARVMGAEVSRIIMPGKRRRLQSRSAPHFLFTTEAKQIVLNHFAGTCNVEEAAEVAGVDECTVYRHLSRDPDFAAAFNEALAQGYVRLEAEALHQRLEAQKRLANPGTPTGEIATEFDRVMKMLARWDRRNGEIGRRRIAPQHRKPVSFDEAITALHKRLQMLNIPILKAPREEGE